MGSPPAGRHRRPAPPSRPVLLVLLAVLALLLGSGTAISLTTTRPPAAPPAGPTTIGLGRAPATESPPTEPAPDRPARAERPESSPEPDAAPDTGEPAPGDEPVDEITGLEDEVARLTNAERAAAGCDELQVDERLRDSARGHSQDMAANDYFDHNGLDGRSPFDRMADAGYPDPAAENIAAGYRSPAEVMEGWMDSEGHRNNILECSYAAIGVGLAFDRDGFPYWTQNFGR